MSIQIVINGQVREFAASENVATIADLIATLNLKADRVAVEHNGELAPRATWKEAVVKQDDRIELVHFVGGGSKT